MQYAQLGRIADVFRSARDGLTDRFHNLVLDSFIKSSMRSNFNILAPDGLQDAKQAYLRGASSKTDQLLNFSYRPVAALATAAGGVAATLMSYVPKFTSKTRTVPTEVLEEHVTQVMQLRTEIVITPKIVDQVSYLQEPNLNYDPRPHLFILDSETSNISFTAVPTARVDVPYDNGGNDPIFFFKPSDVPKTLLNPQIAVAEGWAEHHSSLLWSPDKDFLKPTYEDHTPHAIAATDGSKVFLVQYKFITPELHCPEPFICNYNGLKVVVVPSGSELPNTNLDQFLDGLTLGVDHSRTGPYKVTELRPVRLDEPITLVEHSAPTIQQIPETRVVYEPVEQREVHTHIVDRHETDLTAHFELALPRLVLGTLGYAGAAAYFTWRWLAERYMASPQFRGDLERRVEASLPAN